MTILMNATLERMASLKAFQEAGGSTAQWARENGLSQAGGARINGLLKQQAAGTVYAAGFRDRIVELRRDTNLTVPQIAAACGCSNSYVTRLITKLGLQGQGRKQEAVPADFAERAVRSSTRALAAHYARSVGTISRWRKETGAVYVYDRSEVAKRPAPIAAPEPRKPQRRQFVAGYVPIKAQPVLRDMSLAARAADECLRRIAPVFRCREDGRADPNGTHWFYGRARTADELVAIAERKGWRADAWKDVA